MSERDDYKRNDWELGMELPSRKVTHSNKKAKKKDRSVEEHTAAPAVEKAGQEQAEREKARREQALREKAEREKALREQALREQHELERTLYEQTEREQALREQEQREQVLREQAQREQAQREQAQREQAQREQAHREQAEREQVLREQAEREEALRIQAQREIALREQMEREQLQREHELLEQIERERVRREQAERELARREQAAREALSQPDQAHALREAATAYDETAATIVLPRITERMLRPNNSAADAHASVPATPPAPGTRPAPVPSASADPASVAPSAPPMPSVPAPVAEAIKPASAPAPATGAEPSVTAVTSIGPASDAFPLPTDEAAESRDADDFSDEDAADEDENRGFFKTWQWYLLMTFTPIIIVLVVAYGKIGYVHAIPDSVRDQVPAYRHGEGFVVLKPWWFGPPVFTLDEYQIEPGPATETAEEWFDRYKVELGDYRGIVEDPQVLWSVQTDPLTQ